MQYITIEQLKEHNPCTKELRRVVRFFAGRKRVKVTVELAESLATEFDFEWLAVELLDNKAFLSYRRAERAAHRVWVRSANNASDVLSEAIGRAAAARDARVAYASWSHSEKLAARAREQYKFATNSARARFDQAISHAAEQYKRACARAFALAYLSQKERV